MTPARRAAFQILLRVRHGEFAADLLHHEAARLSKEDARLTTEIVMGCLRRQPQLDFLVAHYSGRSVEKLDIEVRLALHMAIYQMRFLERIPAHAAVSESVQLTRVARRASAAGFVNAVLRKVDRSPVPWPDAATELCLPPWLLNRWRRAFGPGRAAAIAGVLLAPPETYIHVPPGQEDAAAALGAEPTDVPGCFRLLGDSPGPFRIQDIGSQAVGRLLAPGPGMTVLDACAAPGNKTAQLMESGARVFAADVSLKRIAPLGSASCPVVVADAARLPFAGPFDRILVDAPCSGTGTIRRNPEIKWRVGEEDLSVHHERQFAIVRHCAGLLGAGGRLVYSTCSLESIENEAVVERLLQAAPLRLIDTVRRVPGEQPGDGFYAAVLAC